VLADIDDVDSVRRLIMELRGGNHHDKTFLTY